MRYCGRQNSEMAPRSPLPSAYVWCNTLPFNIYGACKYMAFIFMFWQRQRKFADVIEVPNQLIVSESKGKLS